MDWSLRDRANVVGGNHDLIEPDFADVPGGRLGDVEVGPDEVLDEDHFGVFLDARVARVFRGEAGGVAILRLRLRLRLKFCEPLRRHAIDPRIAILAAQAGERGDGFGGFSLVCQRGGRSEFLLADGKHSLSQAHRLLLRDGRGHFGQHRRVRHAEDAERRRVALAEKP